MAQWIVRTHGRYPHLLPHLVETVVSKKWVNSEDMDWVVEMSEEDAEALKRRSFVTSMRQTNAVEV